MLIIDIYFHFVLCVFQDTVGHVVFGHHDSDNEVEKDGRVGASLPNLY